MSLFTFAYVTFAYATRLSHTRAFLKFGELIVRELAQGQIHNYQISLSSGQYLRLIIDHQGMGVGFILYAPDGGRVYEVKRQKVINGKLSLSTDER
ncbi:MAG: hypothetical protein WKF30_03215 [Pyrinomonadaceae bacterium]